jgi:CrcB protein
MLINLWNRILGGVMNLDPGLRAPIAISLGAIPGALSRYYLTLWFAQRLGHAFPYGTFFINLSGALVMGFFTTYTLDRTIVSPDLRLLVATGFLGAYTTFSTYALETQTLLHKGNHGLALLYWAGSAVLGGVGCEIGSQIAKR